MNEESDKKQGKYEKKMRKCKNVRINENKEKKKLQKKEMESNKKNQ